MANQVISNSRKSVKKVALTRKIEESERQLIVGKMRNIESPLVSGQFVSYRCGENYSIHGSNGIELSNSEVVSVAPASVIITLLVKGELEFGYNNLHFSLDADNSPQAVIVNLDKPTSFHRKIKAGNSVSKLNIMISPQWMARLNHESATKLPFLENKESYQNLTFTDEMAALTNQLITADKEPSFIQSISTEIAIQQLILAVCEQLESGSIQSQTAPVQQNKDLKIDQAIHYIETHLSEEISLEKLSSHLIMSVSNLQRRFKQELGMTTAGYIRQRRLEIAKQHIERGTMTITEAAYEAGYHHPSNFSNAFKKAFGYSPKGFLEQCVSP
ncbi:AraC family transcriptional regulator [Vibrio makurazakiensis]|uniref:helix-turn-helix domain-containing protein n=1 Tax=Vibrio makurazakiensis TaxID=2910250 RepID=UPI003D10479C